MKKTLRCCFAGHNIIYNNDDKIKIYNICEKMINYKNINEFIVGNYGYFDLMCSNIIQSLKINYPYIRLCLVIPYLTKYINENKDYFYSKYDEIIIADMPINTPKKFQIIKANEYMINISEYLICGVLHTYGGAYQTYKYAQKKKKYY